MDEYLYDRFYWFLEKWKESIGTGDTIIDYKCTSCGWVKVFDPYIPETNMVHVQLKTHVDHWWHQSKNWCTRVHLVTRNQNLILVMINLASLQGLSGKLEKQIMLSFNINGGDGNLLYMVQNDYDPSQNIGVAYIVSISAMLMSMTFT